MAENQPKPPEQGSPFWRFSLGFYRQPGVADACIVLQERASVDVNMLLFLLWQASLKRALSLAEIVAIEAKIGPWREASVVPLRAIRRDLKTPPGLVEPTIAEAFRGRVKAVELEAERLQQEAMYALAERTALGQPVAFAIEAVRDNVVSYSAMLGSEFSLSALDTIVTAFEAFVPEEP